jgi:hypothetical protein
MVWTLMVVLALAGAQTTTDTEEVTDEVTEGTPIEGDLLSPLEASFCTQALSYWLATAEWPVTSLSIAGQEYSQDQLLALLSQTAPEGETLPVEVAMAQQFVVFKLNVAMGALPTTEAALAAILAEDLLRLSFNGLPSGEANLNEVDTSLMTEQTLVLEEFTSAYDCANVPAQEELVDPAEENTSEEGADGTSSTN